MVTVWQVSPSSLLTMSGGITIFVIAAILAALLLRALWGDFRARDIPNWLVLTVGGLALPWWWAIGLPLWPDIAIQLGAAIVIFAIACGIFALGGMGGGDVKLLTALALWFRPILLFEVLVVMSLVGAVVTIIFAVSHWMRKAEGRAEIPYGIAISVAGLWGLSNDILTISHH